LVSCKIIYLLQPKSIATKIHSILGGNMVFDFWDDKILELNFIR